MYIGRCLDSEMDQRVRLQLLEQEQHVELTSLRTQVKRYVPF